MRRNPVLIMLILTIMFVSSGCGSTVSEIKGDGDASISDIVVKDAVNVKDTFPHDLLGDDIIIKDSEIDIEDDMVEIDAQLGDDGAIEDTVEDTVEDAGEDISYSDITPDALDDAGSDTGTSYCKVGEVMYYTCPDGYQVPHCSCEYKGCMPKCDHIGTRSEGWYNCDGKLIRYGRCKDCVVRCDALGSKSEGWYSDCDGLITYDQCAPEWRCEEDPASLCKTFCKTPCDCPKDAPFCMNGICENPPMIGCSGDNTLCPCGKFCDGNICLEGPSRCLTSCDCLEGYVCVNETCKEKKTSDCYNEPCPCKQHCVESNFGYLCQKGCESNCDCPPDSPICIMGFNGYLCGKLDTPNCGNDDRNCPCMYVCINGRCEKSTDMCNSSCDCKDPAKPSCINMICSKVPDQCTSDADCPCSQACIERVCKEVTRCLSACDCGANEICNRYNICETKSDNSCRNNNDCPCNYLCQNFTCVKAKSCKYSCDCYDLLQPLICKNNLCQPRNQSNRCLTDNDCICGYYCSSNGFCVVGCNDGCDCPKESPYCISNRCSPILIECKQNSECRCKETCVNGRCVSP